MVGTGTHMTEGDLVVSEDPRQLLPNACSIIVVGMNYYTALQTPELSLANASHLMSSPTIFARYAQGDDYHDVMTAILKTLLEYLKDETDSAHAFSVATSVRRSAPSISAELLRHLKPHSNPAKSP